MPEANAGLARPPAGTKTARPAAVVIGGGFGGIAAAIRLQARGYQVSLLEMRDQPGGRAYVYRQDGFTFDAGPPSSPRRFSSTNSSRSAGSARKNTSTSSPVIRFTASSFTTAASSTIPATRRKSLSRSAASTRTMWTAIEFRGSFAGHLRPRLHRPRRPALHPLSRHGKSHPTLFSSTLTNRFSVSSQATSKIRFSAGVSASIRCSLAATRSSLLRSTP